LCLFTSVDRIIIMDQAPEDHSRDFHCWTTPKCRHVHDDPFVKRRLPYPLRVTGSVILGILPNVIFAGILATGVVLVDQYTSINIAISPTMTSVLGFVVGLSITFRNQTAYERYTEGRRLWNQLQFVVRNMGRVIWLQVRSHFPRCGLLIWMWTMCVDGRFLMGRTRRRGISLRNGLR